MNGSIGRSPDGLALSGEFDMDNARQVEELLATFSRAVALDMGAVTFLDSAVLSVIAAACRRGLHVSVNEASPIASKVLSISGVAGLLRQTQSADG
jgi:anti-anti-sigma factor